MLRIYRESTILHVRDFLSTIGWSKLTDGFADTDLVWAHGWPDCVLSFQVRRWGFQRLIRGKTSEWLLLVHSH